MISSIIESFKIEFEKEETKEYINNIINSYSYKYKLYLFLILILVMILTISSCVNTYMILKK